MPYDDSNRPTVKAPALKLMGDDWEERTVVEPHGPRVTLADLHAVVGNLSKSVRLLSAVVAVLAVLTTFHLWKLW